MQSTGLFRYPAEACGSDSSIIRQLCDISDRNKILIHSAIFLIVHGWGFLFTLSNERTGRWGEVNGSVEIVYSCECAAVQMISFDGRCDGDYFRGEILPGGVDTQIYYKDQPSKLSARYLVQGIDHTGRGCRIFIENTGIMYAGETITRPVIYTDSIALKWMETASMYGTLTVVEGQPVITIYTDKNENNGKGEKGSGT